MMTPEEAIRILATGDRNVSKVLEAMDMGVDALKKQIPIKPRRRDSVICCPLCRWCFGAVDVPGVKCCPGCGQRIEWKS